MKFLTESRTSKRAFSTVISKSILLTFLTLAHAAENISEDSFKNQLYLTDYAVEFTDNNGQKISFEAFIERLSNSSFNIVKNSTSRKAVVKLISKADKELPDRGEQSQTGEKNAAGTYGVIDVKSMFGDKGGFNKNKATLVSFYFSECAPCIEEVPALNAFQKEHGDFNTIAVTFDDEKTVERFKSKHGLTWDVASSQESLLDEIKVRAYPSFAIVNQKGEIVAMKHSREISGKDKKLTSEELYSWINAELP